MARKPQSPVLESPAEVAETQFKEDEAPPVHHEVHATVVAERDKLRRAVKVNKNATVRMILEELGVEPAKELIKMALEEDAKGQLALSSDQRIKIWSELLQYQQPKLKSVEHSGKVDQELTIIVKKFDAPAEGMIVDVTPRLQLEHMIQAQSPGLVSGEVPRGDR